MSRFRNWIMGFSFGGSIVGSPVSHVMNENNSAVLMVLFNSITVYLVIVSTHGKCRRMLLHPEDKRIIELPRLLNESIAPSITFPIDRKL